VYVVWHLTWSGISEAGDLHTWTGISEAGLGLKGKIPQSASRRYAAHVAIQLLIVYRESDFNSISLTKKMNAVSVMIQLE
jgi:hypothetical protein